MRDKLTAYVVAGVMVVVLALITALILSVVERYLFGSRQIALALGYLGLLPFCEWLYGLSLGASP